MGQQSVSSLDLDNAANCLLPATEALSHQAAFNVNIAVPLSYPPALSVHMPEQAGLAAHKPMDSHVVAPDSWPCCAGCVFLCQQHDRCSRCQLRLAPAFHIGDGVSKASPVGECCLGRMNLLLMGASYCCSSAGDRRALSGSCCGPSRLQIVFVSNRRVKCCLRCWTSCNGRSSGGHRKWFSWICAEKVC